MIGVIIPVHNEEELLPACLASMKRAAAESGLAGEDVRIVTVLDACTDASEEIARDHGAHVIHSTARNVGIARGRGAEHALDAGARWLAFTDADSEVPPDWLSRQIAWNADVVCGIVKVKDWSLHPPAVKRRYLQRYQARDGHRHIHGANLGIRAAAYRKVGGFPAFAVDEDVAIVRSLEASGASMAWVAEPCVATNGRPIGRLLGGFACYLRALARSTRAVKGDMNLSRPHRARAPLPDIRFREEPDCDRASPVLWKQNPVF